MAGYVNLNGGIGKPLWVVTYPEFIIWFKVSKSTSKACGDEANSNKEKQLGSVGKCFSLPSYDIGNPSLNRPLLPSNLLQDRSKLQVGSLRISIFDSGCRHCVFYLASNNLPQDHLSVAAISPSERL